MDVKAVFITNAGPGTGGGHLSRCFALSQAMEFAGASVSWILNDEASAQAGDFALKDAVFLNDPFSGDTEDILSLTEGASFVLVDSYIPGASFYEAVSKKNRLAVIDDLSDRGVERYSSLVINYGIGASMGGYAPSAARFLLGPRYTPLKREYWDLEVSDGGYVLFVPGAADVLSASERAAGLWGADMPRLSVVLGPLVPEDRKIRAMKAAAGLPNVSILQNPDNFPGILANAGTVICSASVTAYESLALRKKTAVFSVAPNQSGLGGMLHEMGAAYDIGEWKDVSAGKIAGALGFHPKRDVLDRLVNRRGALECARELMRLGG
jgi:spore coat polysaccharide biosynthesis predicted glycosyltransferase SpsG